MNTHGNEVLELLMREVPDAPRLSDLISLQRLSEMLPLLVYGVGEMTRPLAGSVIVKALLGLDQWAGKPPSALPLYICQSTGACLLDAEEKEPLDRDVREWEFDRKMWGEGHELVGRYPPNRPSDRAEALLYLGRHHGQELKEACLSGRWNEYPGDMLAVVREDAFKAFGMASFLEQPRPDPAAVQSEPAAAPEQPAEPVGKIGKRWTEAEKNQMRQQRADGWNDGRIAEHWNFKRQNVARLIGSQSANKATANTPKR